MTENGDDIVAVLERIALMAEVSSHHTPDGSMRLMPAEGVADVIYEAMHTIVDLRIDLVVALEDATEAETFAEELLDAPVVRVERPIVIGSDRDMDEILDEAFAAVFRSTRHETSGQEDTAGTEGHE